MSQGNGKKGRSPLQVVERVDHLSSSLSRSLNWWPNVGTEWDKVMAIFTTNTVSSLASNRHEYQL